ncbi:prophage tail fiber domain protein [Escherichia coli MP021561.3]|nr:prophage tail fiber domain protein [Escherichia coli MP021561.3]
MRGCPDLTIATNIQSCSICAAGTNIFGEGIFYRNICTVLVFL